MLPRMKNRYHQVYFEACMGGTLDQIDHSLQTMRVFCVVLASNGYPVSYEKDSPIRGLATFKEHEGLPASRGTKFRTA